MTTTAKKVSKFFRVAVEGATSDGRTIDRAWLEQIAKNYNPAVYGARINVEHIRGYSPNSDFRSFGDVVAVKVQTDDIGGQKKLALYAQISPTDELVELVKRRQKIYTSIEVRPQFADTQQAYMTGLAVTDNPASLGTEMLAFAAANPDKSPFAARKEQKEDLFTAAEEATLEFEDAPAPDSSVVDKFRTLISGAVAKFSGKAATDDARFAAVAEGFEQMGTTFAEHVGEQVSKAAATDKRLTELQAQLKDLQDKYSALDNTPTGTPRPPATGGSGAQLTDC